jgi:hypothetical protein
MRTRLVVLAGLSAVTLAAPLALAAPAPAPQVTDPAGDATFTANAQPGAPGVPGANQAYADVVSITWAPTTQRVKKKTVVTGFTVTTVLSAPPTPPAGTSLVYRMLGQVNGDAAMFLGPVFYTTVPSDPTQPQSALRDNLTGATRLTKLDLPKVEGSTITWTVPSSALPKELKVPTTLTNLYFEVREIEDFRGQKVPDGVPTYGGSYGLGAGIVDEGKSTSAFTVG